MNRCWQILIVCTGLLLSLQSQAGLPEQSCRKAWSSLQRKNLHKYNFINSAEDVPNLHLSGAQYPFTADESRGEKGNEGYASWLKRTDRKNCYKDWTVLVYMAADNDLTPYALADLYEMEAAYTSGSYAASTLKTDLLVEVDTTDSEGARRLHMFQSPRPYRTDFSREDIKTWNLGSVRSPIVKAVAEDRSDHRERFKEFLTWAVTNYPSKQ